MQAAAYKNCGLLALGRFFNAPVARQMALAEEDGGHRAAIAPDRRGHNVPHNMESRDSHPFRKNGNLLHQDAPLANGKHARSNRAMMFFRPFPGWALQGPNGAAGLAEWALVDRRVLGA